MDKSDHKDVLRQVQQSLNPEALDKLEKRMESMLVDFRRDLAAHPYLCDRQTAENLRWRAQLPFKTFRARLMLGTGTGLACLGILLAILFFNRTPTWAEVEKQFGTIKFCKISAYIRDNPYDRPTFAQYWFSSDGRTRIHAGHSVIFISQDIPLQAFNVKTRSKGHRPYHIKSVLRTLEKAKATGVLTLRSIIEALAGEEIVDTTDLVIADPQVAQDLLVFDARSLDAMWRLRVWALRESRLPIRLLKWRQKNGRYIDLHFTYSKEQRPKFFDPKAFAAELEDASVDDHRLMNRFLQDPGGQAFSTPSG